MIQTIPICNLHCLWQSIRLLTPNSPWTHCNSGIVRHVGLQLWLQFEPRRTCDSGAAHAGFQPWTNTEMAPKLQISARLLVCVSIEFFFFFMMSRPAVIPCTLIDSPLHWSSDYIMIFVKSAFLCTQNASRVTLSLYFWTYVKSSQQNFYTILNAICCQVTMYFLYIAM